MQTLNLSKKWLLGIVALCITAYFTSYVVFRKSHIERWERDNLDYVIFPENLALYLFYRPASLLDARVTGMQFHIGPHISTQEADKAEMP